MLNICQVAKGLLIYCKWNKQSFAQITITNSVYSQEVNIFFFKKSSTTSYSLSVSLKIKSCSIFSTTRELLTNRFNSNYYLVSRPLSGALAPHQPHKLRGSANTFVM